MNIIKYENMHDHGEIFVVLDSKEKPLYSMKIPPKNFLDNFMIKNKKFYQDYFETLYIRELAETSELVMKALNRNVSEKFFKENIVEMLDNKKLVSLNAKGGVREGKSLALISIGDVILEHSNRHFDGDYNVCLNQREFRLKAQEGKMGDYFQVDEHAFSDAGDGVSIEAKQIEDIMNITAKFNIHASFITPKQFLDTSAKFGLKTWGRDNKNFLSRMLVYKLNEQIPFLSGYIEIDIGRLFRKYGCYFYKIIGGCTNPKRLKYFGTTEELHIFKNHRGEVIEVPRGYIDYSHCVPKNYREDIEKAENSRDELNKRNNTCPFASCCKHPLCNYEKKKDKGVVHTLRGGLRERDREEIKNAIIIFFRVSDFDNESKLYKLRSKSIGNLENDVRDEWAFLANMALPIATRKSIAQRLKSYERDGEKKLLRDCKLIGLKLEDLKKEALEDSEITEIEPEKVKSDVADKKDINVIEPKFV